VLGAWLLHLRFTSEHASSIATAVQRMHGMCALCHRSHGEHVRKGVTYLCYAADSNACQALTHIAAHLEHASGFLQASLLTFAVATDAQCLQAGVAPGPCQESHRKESVLSSGAKQRPIVRHLRCRCFTRTSSSQLQACLCAQVLQLLLLGRCGSTARAAAKQQVGCQG
jgi:hypothetical protein